MKIAPRRFAHAFVCLFAGLLTACAGTATPVPGQSQADALRRFGSPTARYELPSGAQRLEFASGPFGRETWMVDVDADGRIQAVRQVLGEAGFADFQQRAAGMTGAELLRTLGTPAERRHGGWQGGERWSWRYPTNDCLWFQVVLADDGRVRGSGYGIDPHCDAASDRD